MKFEVSCTMLFESQEDRDAVVTFLQEKKSVAMQNLPSHIESHDCYNDVNQPCENVVMDKWGD